MQRKIGMKQEKYTKMINRIYTPKQACPRDLGIFFCEACEEKNLEIRASHDYGYLEKKRSYCGNQDYDGKICGITHLGFAWCEECMVLGRKEDAHIGKYEIVGTIFDEDALQ